MEFWWRFGGVPGNEEDAEDSPEDIDDGDDGGDRSDMFSINSQLHREGVGECCTYGGCG